MKIDFAFIGPPRTMTSKIMHTLSSHPQLRVSAPKELKYFSIYYPNERYLEDHYPYGAGKTVYCNPLDCNMEYVMDRLNDHSPDCKIFLGLRSPIERAISHWAVFKYSTMPIGRVRDLWDEMDENYRTFDRRKIKSEGDFLPYCNKWDSCYVPQYMETSCYYHIYRQWTDRGFEVFTYNCNSLSNNFEIVMNGLLSCMGVSRLESYDDRPIHSLRQMGADFSMSDLSEKFRDRYPDIVYQYHLEAKAMEWHTGENLLPLWGL